MKNGLIFLFVIFGWQEKQPVLIREIATETRAIKTDNLGNLYLIKNDAIEKYNPDGVFLKSYSNKTLGPIDDVDASNPMQIVVFYRNFMQVVFLDNTMSQSGDPFYLQNYDLQNATLVCNSYNNGLWFYNQSNFELIRMDSRFQITHRTGNIVQLLGTELKPNFLMEHDNTLYLNDPDKGVMMFDIYGAYYRTLPLKNLSELQIMPSQAIYFNQHRLYSYNLKTLEQEMIHIPDTTAESIRVTSKRMFIRKKKSVSVYEP